MAERRMFAKTIIDSDAFLDMPLTAQALYFHLAMRADDDGFVNGPRKIMRAIGANTDDMRLLITKAFVLEFDSGVVCIKHWKIHNFIRTDRYKPTTYQNELSYLILKDNGAYTLNSGIPTDNQMTTNGIPTDNQMDTQDRLGKNRLDKSIYRVGGNNDVDDNTNQPTNYRPPTLEQVCEYVKERGDKIDAEKFYDVYSANKWLTKRGTPVLDWKAAVRAWERTEYPDKQKNHEKADTRNSSFDTDEYFEAALIRSYGEDHVKTMRGE